MEDGGRYSFPTPQSGDRAAHVVHFTAAVYTWIIDGETARHVPHEHITKHRGGQERHGRSPRIWAFYAFSRS